MKKTTSDKIRKTSPDAPANTPAGSASTTGAAELCRLAVLGGLISPSEGFLNSAGVPVSTTVNVALVHDGSHTVSRLIRNLFGTAEACARQATEASMQVDRYWLGTKLIRGGADLVNREVYDRGDQRYRLGQMMPFLALKSPCFYLRGAPTEKAVLQAFSESFDRKVLFNFAGSDFLSSLVDGRKEGPALRFVSLVDRVLRGEAITLPGCRDKDVPRLVHGKGAGFFELSRATFDQLMARGRPQVLRLLKQSILVDLSSEADVSDSCVLPSGNDREAAAAHSVIQRRMRGDQRPLFRLDFRSWEELVQTKAIKSPDFADWLDPYFDLPGKLAAAHLLAPAYPTTTQQLFSRVCELSFRTMNSQLALLKAVTAKRRQGEDEVKEAAIVQRLAAPKKFRELARTFADQRKQAIWPSLARLMAAGRVVQVEGDRYLAVTTEEPEEEARRPFGHIAPANPGERRDGCASE